MIEIRSWGAVSLLSVTALRAHARPPLLYGARYSPHDNPVERIWAGLKNYVANTAAQPGPVA